MGAGVRPPAGQLHGPLASLGRFSEEYAVPGAHLHDDSLTVTATKNGPPSLLGRLWRQGGVGAVLSDLLRPRPLEVVTLFVLLRLQRSQHRILRVHKPIGQPRLHLTLRPGASRIVPPVVQFMRVFLEVV